MTKQRHLVFSGFPRVFLPFPGLSKHNDRHFQTPSFRGTAAQIYPTKLHIQFLFAFVMPIINGCLLEVSEKFFFKANGIYFIRSSQSWQCQDFENLCPKLIEAQRALGKT